MYPTYLPHCAFLSRRLKRSNFSPLPPQHEQRGGQTTYLQRLVTTVTDRTTALASKIQMLQYPFTEHQNYINFIDQRHAGMLGDIIRPIAVPQYPPAPQKNRSATKALKAGDATKVTAPLASATETLARPHRYPGYILYITRGWATKYQPHGLRRGKIPQYHLHSASLASLQNKKILTDTRAPPPSPSSLGEDSCR